MKKLIALGLALILMLSTVTVVMAAEAPNMPTGSSNVIHFDVTTTGWQNFKNIYCHIWALDGSGDWPVWQSKREKCTDYDGDGVWTYDLDDKGLSLSYGKLYVVVFSNENGMQTYNLLFDKTVIGDTAYCDGTRYENPADSSKTALAAFWKGESPAVFGPELCITVTGNVVGTCIPYTSSAVAIFEEFLKEDLENARLYGGKTDQKLIDNIASKLGLSDAQVTQSIKRTGVKVSWSADFVSDPAGEDYGYQIVGNKTIEITGYTGEEYYLEIPSTIDGYKVVGIGGYAFDYNTKLRTVTIPNTVTYIDGCAFCGCENLYDISIPSSVTEVGYYAFENTPWFEEQSAGVIYINNMLYGYNNYFYSNGTYVVKTGTTKICDYAFEYCERLKSIIIPNTVTSIGFGAFYGSGLTEITIPSSVIEVGSGAFSHTPWFENQPDGAVYIGSVLYCYKGDKDEVTSLTIKEGTITISDDAFEYCENLTSVEIPDTVTTIGGYAFYDCEKLKSVTIPASVKKIGENAFGYFNYDIPIDVAPGESLPKVAGFKIYGYNNTEAQRYAKDNGFAFSSLGNAPKVDTPIIKSAEVNNSGIKLSWDKVSGGENYKYRVFYKNGSSWKTLATVSGNTSSYVDTTATVGNSYTYTIRCVDNNNEFVSDYDKTGFTIRFLETPEIKSFVNVVGGTVISWDKVEGAEKYRLYVKRDGSWTKLADTEDTSFIHTGLTDGTEYTYTIRCVSADSKTLESRYNSTGYKNVYKKTTVLRGDVDADGVVSVLDATEIQLVLAGIKPWNDLDTYHIFADFDEDGKVSIMDATEIQMVLAGLK